jgi:GlcNAc-P-P-Und epimerase
MKILVIGGSGFIGTRLIGELIGHGHEVANLDRRESASYPERTTLGDVRSQAAVDAASRGREVIINLAAEHRDDVRPVSLYESVNLGGARVVAQAATTNGVSRIVFTSTVAVYGLGKTMPAETCATEPFNEYGRTKLAAEAVLTAWARADPSRALAIVRPTVVFGEGNRGNVYTLIKQMASRQFVMIGDGQNRKSLAYVGNLCAFLAGRVSITPGIEITNYADKPDLTVRQLVTAVRGRLGGRPLLPFALPRWSGLAIGYCFDALARISGRSLPISAVRVRKFCAETSIGTERLQASGFQATFGLDDALERTIRADFGRGRR